jgi:FtsP/CotA-like multicopper oxidase with cupredoxin domain
MPTESTTVNEDPQTTLARWARRLRPTRRRVVRLVRFGAAALAAVVLVVVGVGAWFYTRAVESNVGDLSFANELDVPPLLEPTADDDGRKVFELDFQAGETELLDGQLTETWGLNGTYLGPTLRAERGDRVEVRVTNGVSETTTLHWHGMHLPAEMDGGPHQMVDPGETWSPTWDIDQPAATLWYHPHLMGETADHVYRGAAGMFILDDDEARDTGLPDDYGIDDVPLIVQDKRFDSDGSLDDSTSFMSNVGVLGDEILINGTHDPYFEATTSLVRFRVLNASNARVYNLGFADDRPYWLVGTDSGLLEQPHETTRLQLSPGERAEIVVDVEPGERAVLRSHSPDLGVNFPQDRFNGGDDTFDLLEIRGAPDLDDSGPLPETLVEMEAPTEDEAVGTRTFDFTNGHTINGREMDPGRIDQVVEVDTTEIWEITNDHGTPHSFHPHLIHFAVLDVDGEAPPPPLQGWKDTIYVPPGSTIRVIARFEDYTDPDTPYMFHCHVLRHEDGGMMGQFVVVGPGEEPDPSALADATGDRHDHSAHGS